MIRPITNTIQEVARLLNRDVRDLFKAQGIIVDDGFLDELGRLLHKAGVDQKLTEYLVAEVGSAWRGRIVQMDQVLEVIRIRLREALK